MVDAFAYKHKNQETLLSSSSGGVFYELAKFVIENNGVVFGAAYDENFMVNHIGVDSLTEIKKLQGSKYVRSNLLDSYNKVYDTLLKNKKVLFSGTPCQCAGLYKYLESKKANIENLITIDIICHGTPDHKVYELYITKLQKKFRSKLRNLSFRDKSKGDLQCLSATFENGNKYYKSTTQDLYYKAFLYDYILMSGCYSCRYTTLDRHTDISLGDCWGYNGNIEKNGGISLVLINSDKGSNLMKNLNDKFQVEKINIKDVMQAPLCKPAKVPFLRNLVYRKMKKGKYLIPNIILTFVRIKNKLLR